MKKIIFGILAFVLCLYAFLPEYDPAEFVDDIKTKSAPECIVETLDNGNKVIGTIYDENGKQFFVSPEDISIVSLKDALDQNSTVNYDLRTEFLFFYDNLMDGVLRLSLCTDLNDLVYPIYGPVNDGDNLVIKELFFIDILNDDYKELLANPKTTLTLKLNTKLDKDTFFSAVSFKDRELELVKDIKLADDGYVQITSKALCPVAIVVPGEMNTIASGFNPLYIIVPVGIIAVFVLDSLRLKKSK